MALEPGTRLGHYEVVSSLGAGGMGEVYRAKDTKLGREVAVKLLLEEVSADPERLGALSPFMPPSPASTSGRLSSDYCVDEGSTARRRCSTVPRTTS